MTRDEKLHSLMTLAATRGGLGLFGEQLPVDVLDVDERLLDSGAGAAANTDPSWEDMDDIPDQPSEPTYQTCPHCGCVGAYGRPCSVITCPSNQPDPEPEPPTAAAPEADAPECSALRLLLREGQRALTLEQTGWVRDELAREGVAPTARTARADRWDLELETLDGAEGKATVVLPRDRTQPGTLTWRPRTRWVDQDYTQLEEAPAPTPTRSSNGGRAIAQRLLAQIGAA